MNGLVVGLGNPGAGYARNRHNVGHMLIDELKKTKIPGVMAVKTNTFMNDSGNYVKKIINKDSLKKINFYVAHDDLDIPLGKYKIQKGKGPKDHNGLNSIYSEISTDDFWHIRIGVENRDAENKSKGQEYVLSDFTSVELKIINKVLQEIVNKLKLGK